MRIRRVLLLRSRRATRIVGLILLVALVVGVRTLRRAAGRHERWVPFEPPGSPPPSPPARP